MFFSLANNRKLANFACYSKRFHDICSAKHIRQRIKKSGISL